MSADDLTQTPADPNGWASGGNYSLRPRSQRKAQLNVRPVGERGSGNTDSAEANSGKKRKGLNVTPVGEQKQGGPSARRTPAGTGQQGAGGVLPRRGSGLSVTPVGGAGGGNPSSRQGASFVTPPSVPSPQETEEGVTDEWGDVDGDFSSLGENSDVATGEGEGKVIPPMEENATEGDEWGEVNASDSTLGERRGEGDISRGGDVDLLAEGDEWGDVDGDFSSTPGGDESVSPSPVKRKMGASIYPPGYGEGSSLPEDGSLLSPVTGEGDMGEDVLSTDEGDEWGDVDGDFSSLGEDVEVKPSGKKGNKAPSKKVKNRVKPLVATSNDDGWDDDNPAMSKEGIEDDEELKSFITSSKGVRITERDIDIIRFLARYRYAQGVQVARYVGSSKRAIEQRLTKLGKAGLLRREDVTKGQSLWTPTGWGLSTADLDYTAIGAGKISYVTIAHTLGLVNLGIELEIAEGNVLNFPKDVFPRHNRYNEFTGEFEKGETVITERQIRQSETRWKKSMARIDIERAFRTSLEEWRSNGGVDVSPELELGNEAMFVIWGTRAGRSDHIPDMVVAGSREPDGSTNNYAIELELTAKPIKEWERVLGTFADARDLYSQVHYFTHKTTIKNSLLQVAERVGLTGDEFFVHKYIPRQGGLPFWG